MMVEAFEKCGIALPDFSRMCELYKEWNEKINVISRKDIDNVFEHHILHSLCIALYLKTQMPQVYEQWESGVAGASDGGAVAGGRASSQASRLSVLDVGCGGGFPGVPLAMMFPNVEFTLCDSIGKKVRVASEVAAALGLKNVRCVHSRVEELPGEWDYVVSRAVTSLDNFLPWVKGRYRCNILYLKGGDMTAELDACMRKYGRCLPGVKVWNIASAVESMPDNDYFAEKLVVNLGSWQK